MLTDREYFVLHRTAVLEPPEPPIVFSRPEEDIVFGLCRRGVDISELHTPRSSDD
jgi:hypothetical protein